MKKIPVVILNGFLGSGKTTLFRNLLSQSKKKNISTCAIVNDMSQLDVDGELIASSAIIEENNKMLESISSHILSSNKGIRLLDQALKNLLHNQKPEIIIIETSGSCHPMPLIKYFKNQRNVYLSGVFVLIDSLMITQDYDCGENLIPELQKNMIDEKRGPINLLVEQILFSSHLILTKGDRIKDDNLKKICSQIQKINPFAKIHSIIFGKLNIESLFELEEYNYFNVEQLFRELKPILEFESETDRPYDLATKVITDDRPFHPERLWKVFNQHLKVKIYRSKGFFWLASRPSQSLLFNQAAGSINFELLGIWRAAILEEKNNNLQEIEVKFLKEQISKESGRFGDRCCELTIIGDKTQIDEFAEKIESCFLTDEEIIQWENGFNFKDPWPKNLLKINN
tara:strand:- start:1855 stop:3051 length:1197 start_codon:yes stop_codon:yes gene_type:complete